MTWNGLLAYAIIGQAQRYSIPPQTPPLFFVVPMEASRLATRSANLPDTQRIVIGINMTTGSISLSADAQRL
jgi:hypothetical protein